MRLQRREKTNNLISTRTLSPTIFVISETLVLLSSLQHNPTQYEIVSRSQRKYLERSRWVVERESKGGTGLKYGNTTTHRENDIRWDLPRLKYNGTDLGSSLGPGQSPVVLRVEVYQYKCFHPPKVQLHVLHFELGFG